MIKVLLIQEYIPHYRVDIFNELAKYVDLTVIYSKGEIPEAINFKTFFVKTIKIHWKFHIRNLFKYANNFDVLICMLDTGFLDFRLLSMFKRKFKIIYWGTGVLFDKDMRYDGDKNTHYALSNVINRSDATIFYCDYPKKKYTLLGISEKKLFVAHNTVHVLPINKFQNRDSILFVGTLYKGKGIFELLFYYNEAYKINNDIPKLFIVGEGSEFDNIKQYIADKELENKIFLEGGIYDETILQKYFSSAIICISPNQAGLSVLKAMGYGTTYITHNNAITGGELFNIQHKVTGILLEDFSELKEIISNAMIEREKYYKIGQNALNHYYSNRTVKHMVDGFVEAIDFTLNSR